MTPAEAQTILNMLRGGVPDGSYAQFRIREITSKYLTPQNQPPK